MKIAIIGGSGIATPQLIDELAEIGRASCRERV